MSNLSMDGAACSIKVSGASSLQEGEWEVTTVNAKRFVDRVTVKIDTGIASNAFFS